MSSAVISLAFLLPVSSPKLRRPLLAAVAAQAFQDGVHVQTGNNVGYYGPYEAILRNSGDSRGGYVWQGCQAGMNSLGIEADGAIKGCPSLPTKAYTGGNIKERSLAEIVNQTEELNFNNPASEEESVEHLWGFCKSMMGGEEGFIVSGGGAPGGIVYSSGVFFC